MRHLHVGAILWVTNIGLLETSYNYDIAAIIFTAFPAYRSVPLWA